MEYDFHNFVKLSLDFLGQKAFLLCIDDIDTDFSKGWPMLETIRKYLATPQLLLILSGDLSLYSPLIRKQQWENFGKALLENERSEAQQHFFSEMVEKLEGQYLLKILNAHNRVDLQNLKYYDDLYKKSPSEFQIRGYRKGNPEILLSKLLENICRVVFSVTPPSMEYQLYYDFILSLPLRTSLQIFLIYDKISDNWEFGEDKRGEFCRSFGTLLISSLVKFHYGTKAIAGICNELHLGLLAEKLLLLDKISDGFRFLPCYSSEQDNQLILFLGACLKMELIKHPGKFFDFMIKIGLPREYYQRLASSLDKQCHPEKRHWELKRYIEFTNLNVQENSIQVSRLHYAYIYQGASAITMAGYLNTYTPSLLKSGTIVQIAAASSTISDNSLVDTHSPKTTRPLLNSGATQATKIETTETLEKKISNWRYLFLTLPSFFLLNKSGESRQVFSFYSILGFLDIVCNAMPPVENWPQDKNEEEQLLASCMRLLKEHSQLRKVTTHDQSGDLSFVESAIENGNDETTNEHFDSNDGTFKILISCFYKWKKEFTLQNIPPHVIAKIWLRFYYTAENNNANALGDGIHRFIVAFLHAVLVEEWLDLKLNAGFSLKNPSRDDLLLVKKLEYCEKNDSHFQNGERFFNHLFSCPLWGFYLTQDTAEKSVWLKYISAIKDKYGPELAAGKITAEQLFETQVTDTDNSQSYPSLQAILNQIQIKSNQFTNASETNFSSRNTIHTQSEQFSIDLRTNPQNIKKIKDDIINLPKKEQNFIFTEKNKIRAYPTNTNVWKKLLQPYLSFPLRVFQNHKMIPILAQCLNMEIDQSK